MLSWWIVLIIVVLFLLIVGLALWLMFRNSDPVPYEHKFRLKLSTKTSIRNLFIRANAAFAKMVGRSSILSRDSIDTLLQLKEIPITFQCVPKPVPQPDLVGTARNLVRNLDGTTRLAMPVTAVPVVSTNIYDRYECKFFNEIYAFLGNDTNEINPNNFQQEQYWTIDHVGLVLNIMVENTMLKYYPAAVFTDGVLSELDMVRADRALPLNYVRINLATARSGYFSKIILPTIRDKTVIVPIDDIIKYIEIYVAVSKAAEAANHLSTDISNTRDLNDPGISTIPEQDQLINKYFIPCPDKLSDETFFIDLICRPIPE